MGETINEDGQGWNDQRLSELCAAQGSSPTVFGPEANAWRTAANHLMAAHNRRLGKDTDGAQRHRDYAFKVLRDAGLHMEQAAASQQTALPPQRPKAPSPAETASHMTGTSARRMAWLNDAADNGRAEHAMALGGLYGAAGLYRRAVSAFSRREDTAGHTYMRAAEEELRRHRLRAPWHRPSPQDNSSS